MYSNIRSRAGLVALIFVLIISLASAVPIPTQAGLSSTSFARRARDGKDLIQRDIGQIAHISRNTPISIVSATTGAITSSNVPVEVDTHPLVRRNFIKKLFHKIGSGIKHVAEKIGHGIKKAAQAVGHGIKKAAQKVGKGIKTAAKKVGGFVKHTLGKVAKFGLKIVSVAQELAGKVVGFIPGIGKPLGKVLEGASKVTGFISDKIHANLGKKLEKGMKVMNKADKVMGYIPRNFEDEGDFQERGIGAAYDYFEGRDYILLEGREDPYFGNLYERSFDYYLDWE
jgi:hypothetical protein